MDSIPRALTSLATQSPQIEILWLYGSRAKGTASNVSDYDLAVSFKDIEPDPLERRLRPELLAQQWADALNLAGDRLSVVDIDRSPVPLATAIVTEGKVLYCNNPQRLAVTENRITSMWELDYLHHIKHYSIGLGNNG